MNIIGLDWDDISLEEAHRRQASIQQTERIPTLLYQTKHGFHCELLYPNAITPNENFKIREKYWDDPKRLFYSKLRHRYLGSDHHDFLFSIKNGQGRRLIG